MTIAPPRASQIDLCLNLGLDHGLRPARAARLRQRQEPTTREGAIPPEAMAGELTQGLLTYHDRFRPGGSYERGLVDQAAACHVVIGRLVGSQLAGAEVRARHAARLHDRRRDERMGELVTRLETEPVEAIRLLSETSEGCDHLSDDWGELALTLELDGRLDEAGRARLLRLLGHFEPPTGGVDRRAEAAWAASGRLASATPEAPADPADLQHLRTLAAHRRDAYKAKADRLWERYDRHDRHMLAEVALADPSPEGRQLVRDIATADRLRRQLLGELAAHRGEPNPFGTRRSRSVPRPSSTAPSASPSAAERATPSPTPIDFSVANGTTWGGGSGSRPAG